MNGQRNFLILIAALLMGGIAVYLANAYFTGMEQRNAKIAEQLKLKTVITARVPIAFGDPLTPDKLSSAGWPADSVPEAAFSDVATAATDPNGPRIALRSIAAGEPILQSMVTGPGGRGVISATLPKDKRAVAIRVNDVTGVAGFTLPGDMVDVLLTRQPDNGNGRTEQITDLIVENVRVIASDQNANESSKDPQVSKTVTLEVDPAQAQKLALASQIGSLSLALRNSSDQEQVDIGTMRVDDLAKHGSPAPSAPRAVSYRRPAAPRAPAPSGPNIVVVKGLKVSNVEVSR